MKKTQRSLAALLSFVLAFTNTAPAVLPFGGFSTYAAEKEAARLSTDSDASRASDDPLEALFQGGLGEASKGSGSNAHTSGAKDGGGTKTVEQQLQEIWDEDGQLKDGNLVDDIGAASASDAERKKEAEKLEFGPEMSVSFVYDNSDLPDTIQVNPGTLTGTVSYVKDRAAFLKNMQSYTEIYERAAERGLDQGSVSLKPEEQKSLRRIADELETVTLDPELLCLLEEEVPAETVRGELASGETGIQQQVYASVRDGDEVYYPVFTGSISAPKGVDGELSGTYYRYVAVKSGESSTEVLAELLEEKESRIETGEDSVEKALDEGCFVVGADPENRFYGILPEDTEEDCTVSLSLCLNYVTVETALEKTEMKDGSILQGTAKADVSAVSEARKALPLLLDATGSAVEGTLEISAAAPVAEAVYLVPDGSDVTVTQMLQTDQEERLEARTVEGDETRLDETQLTVSLPRLKLSSPKRTVSLKAGPAGGKVDGSGYYELVFKNDNTLDRQVAQAVFLTANSNYNNDNNIPVIYMIETPKVSILASITSDR